MEKKAIIFDLDNTIYPVAAIGHQLFADLFQMITMHGGYQGAIEDVQQEIMRKPFQVVAKAFQFDATLTAAGLALLSDLTYTGAMQPFEDYALTKKINCRKFLVTTGFTKLQHSKIDMLGIKNDFEAIIVVDPSLSSLTKKDVFKDILLEHQLKEKEVLVVGDDLHSEIKAAQELGIDTVLYDYQDLPALALLDNSITSFSGLQRFL